MVQFDWHGCALLLTEPILMYSSTTDVTVYVTMRLALLLYQPVNALENACIIIVNMIHADGLSVRLRLHLPKLFHCCLLCSEF